MSIEDLIILKEKLSYFLDIAPMEDECTDTENVMYAEMQNLVESINNYLRGLENGL